jgi:hypothetical protein
MTMKPPPAVPVIGFDRTAVVPGELIVAGRTCPRCGSALFVKAACCGWAKAGWSKILRCIKAGCVFAEGFERNETFGDEEDSKNEN